MSDPIMSKSQFKIWFLIPLIVFVGLIIMFFARLGKPTDVVINQSLNKPVPSFELPLLTDTTKNASNNDLPNSPYLINVWGSWCATCYVEHPYLLQLHDEGVPIVGVNYQDELDNALQYLKDGGDPYVFSFKDDEGSFAIDLGLTGAPETFVVDSNGNIRQHILGEINEQNWQARIEPCYTLLKQLDNNPDLEQSETNNVSEVCK